MHPRAPREVEAGQLDARFECGFSDVGAFSLKMFGCTYYFEDHSMCEVEEDSEKGQTQSSVKDRVCV